MLPRSRLLVIEWFHNWWRVDWCRVELWEQNRCYWWYRSWNGRACAQLSAWIWRWINWLMPHDASSELVKSSLDALSSIGEVSVTMIGPDSQVSYLGGYKWTLVHCLFLWLMISTWLGQVSMSVTKAIVGILRPLMGLIMDQLSFQTYPIYPPWYQNWSRAFHTTYASVLQMQWDPVHSSHPTRNFKYRTNTNLHLHWKWAA